MSPFDIGVALVLLVSGFVAFVRGATREVTTVVAFLLAVGVALFGLRFTGPIARQAIHTAWIANSVAVLATFIAGYIVFRVIGGAITRRVQQTAGLSGLDRMLGLGIGLVRGAVVVGAVTLLINAATPAERMPPWIAKAKTYPAATTVADGLRALAPEGLKMAHSVEPSVRDAVDAGVGAPPGDKTSAKPHASPHDEQESAR